MPHAAKGIREAIEEIQMKRSFGFALCSFSLLRQRLPATNPNRRIPQNVQVGSTQIPAGQYELT